MMPSRSASPAALAAGLAAVAAAGAVSGPPEVIFTKIPGHPTAVVPGAVDTSGNAVTTYFKSIEALSLSPDGSQWGLTARTTQDVNNNIVLLQGSDASGSVLCQQGQPFRGGVGNEQYFFFQAPNPIVWNTAGQMLFTARARNGNANTAQKVVRVTGGTHTIVHQQGDPALGVLDEPVDATGDEAFGQTFSSLYLFDSGIASFRNTIVNCATSRSPAIFHGSTSFRQSGVSMIGSETWDFFTRDGAGGTPDGAHWFAFGEVILPDTFTDNILVVDDQIVLRESTPLRPGGPPMNHLLSVRMLANGDWYARGDDYFGGYWAVRNGTLMAESNAQILPGLSEYWRNTFAAITGNRLGRWVVAGTTDALNGARDEVVVLNGRRVVLREGDRVDLNGNGLPDDDAFIGRGDPALAAFSADNMFLADDLVLYFIASLRNGAGQDLNTVPVYGPPTALLRVQLYCPADHNSDGYVDGIDYDTFHNDFEAGDPAADYNGDGFVDGIDVDQFNNDFEAGC